MTARRPRPLPRDVPPLELDRRPVVRRVLEVRPRQHGTPLRELSLDCGHVARRYFPHKPGTLVVCHACVLGDPPTVTTTKGTRHA